VDLHYGDYLRSERWAQLRDAAIKKAEGRCQVCNSPEELNVHHRDYGRLGEDGEERDLVVLCQVCHEGYHFIIAEKRPKKRESESIYPQNVHHRPSPTNEDIQQAGGVANYFFGVTCLDCGAAAESGYSRCYDCTMARRLCEECPMSPNRIGCPHCMVRAGAPA